MLESLAIFLQDGTLFQTNAPTLIQGDNKSVKLFVTFWESSATRVALNLINYIVEAVVERPDGSVSPALTLSIDKDPTQRYLVINNWITEFAGTIKFTIRLKQGETIKATGFLNWQVGGGNVPADTTITEPQHESLQEAINAEETARHNDITDLRNSLGVEKNLRSSKDDEIEGKINSIDAEIVRVDNATKANAEAIMAAHQSINNEQTERKNAINQANVNISNNEQAITNLGNNVQTSNEKISNLEKDKLDKIWNSISLINELADNDYFIINSGNSAYKLTVANLKQLLGTGSGSGSNGGVNHYKGDYLSYDALVSANPSAEAGDYAFVNTTTDKGDLLVMYIWDADAAMWKETKSDQYVLSTSFINFQNALLTGATIVKQANGAYKYITSTGEEINIETALVNINNNIQTNTNLINNITALIGTLQQTIANKQNQLTEGEGITIENNVISVNFKDNTEQVANLQEQITANKGSIDDLTENVTQIEGNVETNATNITNLQNTQNAFITGSQEVKVAAIAKESTTATNYKKTTGESSNIEEALNKIIADITNGNTIVHVVNNYVETDSEGTTTYASIDVALKSVNAKLVLSEETINTLGGNINTLNNDMAEVKDTKLNKKWTDISVVNELADDDYFVLNSGSKTFKVSVASMRELLGMSGSVNHYKGDYLSLSALQTANPTANAGDYAFVNTTTDNGDILIMYIWDTDANVWKQTKSDQYVLSNAFVDFSNGLQDGTIVVKVAESASNYKDSEGNTHNIDEKISDLESSTKYTNSTPTPAALGGIAKGTTFDNKSIVEVLNMLLYPYVSFSATMSTSPSGGTIEKGTSVTLTSATVNITLGSAAISSISIVSSLNETTVIASKTSDITAGSNVISLPNNVISTNQTIKAIIKDSTGASKTVSSTAFTFVDPYYYGAIGANAELTETLIKGLTKDVKSKGNKSYTINMTQQKAVIAYPSSYGVLTTILDANGFNVTETFVRNTLTINSVSYYVYVLDSAATSSMKYTFNY